MICIMTMKKDSLANKVLRELREDIVNLVDVDQVARRFVSWNRISSSDLDQLQNAHTLVDQKRKEQLYDTALVGKGRKGLDAFLRVLEETAHQYKPHDVLAKKLRKEWPLSFSRRLSEVLLNVIELAYMHAYLNYLFSIKLATVDVSQVNYRVYI